MRIKKAIILNMLLTASVFGLAITGVSYYQNDVSEFVDVTLDSKVLKESRKVFIRLPDIFIYHCRWGRALFNVRCIQ